MNKVIIRKADELLTLVREDSKHHMPPNERRKLYILIRQQFRENAILVMGYLAVLSAEKVLSIFEREMPDVRTPRNLLKLAGGILSGKREADSRGIRKYMEFAFLYANSGWGMGIDNIGWNADLAGYAAYKAIAESIGSDLLRDNRDLAKFNIYDLEPDYIAKWDDEALASSKQGDTAATAAVAFSCSSESPRCDPLQLLEFWEWWLQDALLKSMHTLHLG